MKKGFIVIVMTLVLGLSLVAMSCAPQAPVGAAEFYDGAIVDMIGSDDVGGDGDLSARLVAGFLSRDSGAKVPVTNRAEAGGLEGVNYIFRAKADGLTLGQTSGQKFVTNQVLGEAAADYELDKLTYWLRLGKVQYYMYVDPNGPFTTVDAMIAADKAGKIQFGGGSPAGGIALGGMTTAQVLGLTNAQVVTGIRGEGNRVAMTQRGEIAGYVLNVPTTKASVAAGMVMPLFVLATERDPLSPDVPAITELIDLSPENRALIELWGTALVGSNLFIAPGGIPQDRYNFLVTLANGWAEDEDFREALDLISGFHVVGFETGDTVTQSILRVAQQMEPFKAVFASMIEKYRA